jgi:hypothetical protein
MTALFCYVVSDIFNVLIRISGICDEWISKLRKLNYVFIVSVCNSSTLVT